MYSHSQLVQIVFSCDRCEGKEICTDGIFVVLPSQAQAPEHSYFALEA